MPYVERTDEEIMAAWERKLETTKNPDRETLFLETGTYSIRTLIVGMRAGNKECLNFGVGHARRHGQIIQGDPVEEITRQ